MQNKAAINQILRVSLAALILTGAMLAVYALIGRLTVNVIGGALFGYVMSVANFFALSVTVSRAADRVQAGESPASCAGSVRVSSAVRLIVLLVIYFIVLKFSPMDPLASVIPLLLMQIAIRVTEFFRKEDEP